MPELISQPGLQFHVFKLKGILRYSLTIPNKPIKNFELSEDDFDIPDVSPTETSEAVATGLNASAVGLELTIIKNVGCLEMRFEGIDGGSARWKFENLQETGRASGLYASAITQTRISETPVDTQTSAATALVQGQPQTTTRLISEACEAEIRAKKVKIRTLLCEGEDGETWWINPTSGTSMRSSDDANEVQEVGTSESDSSDSSESSEDPMSEDETYEELVAPEFSAKGIRSSDRLKPPKAGGNTTVEVTESTPRYLLLRGVQNKDDLKLQRGTSGEVRLDRKTGEFGFWKMDNWLDIENIQPHPANSVQWTAQDDIFHLQILQDGSPVFTSYHQSDVQPTGYDTVGCTSRSRVRIDDVLTALRKRFVPESTIEESTKDADTRAEFKRQMAHYADLKMKHGFLTFLQDMELSKLRNAEKIWLGRFATKRLGREEDVMDWTRSSG